MLGIPRGPTFLLILAVAVAGLTISACGRNQTSQPTLNSSEVVGTWTGPLGTMIFHADRTFEGQELKLNKGCSGISGAATWQFLSSAGVSSSNPTFYKKGDLIAVDFIGANSACSFQLTSWEIKPPVGLCLDLDPDSPCSSSPFRREG